MSVLGIDLSASPQKLSAYALIDVNGELREVDNFGDTNELLTFLSKHVPSVIAIAAPMSLPLGLDCLEEDHDCRHVLKLKGRVCEHELAKRRIACFFTTKQSIIKKMIYRALTLKATLEAMNYLVIEVYPYATKTILFGGKMPPKNTVRGVAFLRNHISGLVKGIDDRTNPLNGSQCDAILGAYTGHLHMQNKTDLIGVPEEGLIVIPSTRQITQQ